MATFEHVIPHVYEKHRTEHRKHYSWGGDVSGKDVADHGANAFGSGLTGAVMGGVAFGPVGAGIGGGLGLLFGGLRKTKAEKEREERANAIKAAKNSTPQNVGLDPMSQGAVLSSHGISENSLSPYGGQSSQNQQSAPPAAGAGATVTPTSSYKLEEDSTPAPAPVPAQMNEGGKVEPKEQSLSTIAFDSANKINASLSASKNKIAKAHDKYKKYKDMFNRQENYLEKLQRMQHMQHMQQMLLASNNRSKDDEKNENFEKVNNAILIAAMGYASYKNNLKKDPSNKKKAFGNAFMSTLSNPMVNQHLNPNQQYAVNSYNKHKELEKNAKEN